MRQYKKGEWVQVTTTHADVSHGVSYKIVLVLSDRVRIVDDAGDVHEIRLDELALANSAPITDANVEDDYETAKANERVTSAGLFDKGDCLVYRDGTPTNEARTVTHCTATCVWFEETYSMPFNPVEFMREYDDE